MITKRIIPFAIIIAIFLTACGGESSKADDTGNWSQESSEWNNGESESGEVSTSGYWETWVNNVPEGPFVNAGSESFTLEHNGYSIEITVDQWTGTRGTGESMLHPANSLIPLPAYDSTICVIPFVVTATTTTKDSSFTTDYQFSIVKNPGERSTDSYLNDRLDICDLSRLEDFKENYENNLARTESQQSQLDDEYIKQWQVWVVNSAWSSSSNRNLSGTMPGDIQTMSGCYIIEDYYSPDHPEGNTDLLSDVGACLLLRASVEGSDQESFLLTMYQK